MPNASPTFDATAFLNGACGNPDAWFGMHLIKRGLIVRAFLPGAERVELMDVDTGKTIQEMSSIHPEGIYELLLPRRKKTFKHRFRVYGWGDGAYLDMEDAYRFPPVLGEMDHWLHAEGRHYRLYEVLGAHPRSRDGVAGTAFAVWAPNARRVSVVGSFNNWDGRRHILRRFPASGLWELFVPHVHPGDLYKFEILGEENDLQPLKADPYALLCEHPPNSASVVHGLRDFPWSDDAWMADRWKRNRHDAPLSIYEVHIGSWRRKADGSFLSYRELAEQLIPYVAEMGFTHLQLLPVSEHPYYGSWGYQPLGLFAPTSRYGDPEDFKAFVDACHRAGIGVILDWVPAHFPGDDHGLARFDGSHLYEHADPRKGRHMDWGTLIYNFGRTEVQNFLIANALYWMDRFHIDGLRVDAVASMLYLDYSRKAGEWTPNRFGGRENMEAVAFLRRLNTVLYQEFPDCFTVAEESTAWPMVSRPTDIGGLGFGFKWNMGWMHDTLRYLGRPPFYRRFYHEEITFSMLYAHAENYVLPLSHDEVVHGKRSLLWRMPGKEDEQLAHLRLLYAYLFAHTGKKLLFMGCEFGQAHEWNHTTALDWHWLDHPGHLGLSRLVRDLNRLYRTTPAMYLRDCADEGFRWIDCGDRRNSVLSLIRKGESPDDFVLIVLNFSGTSQVSYRVGTPRAGQYQEILNTDSIHYGGQNSGNLGKAKTENIPMHGLPHSFALTLPPLSAIFLKPDGPTTTGIALK